MSTLLAPLWALLAPLRALIKESPWTFCGILVLLMAVSAALGYYIATAFFAVIMSFVMMWISEHQSRPAEHSEQTDSQRPG